MLDHALKGTFPASDPVAELPVNEKPSEKEEAEEQLLDDAVEMTFPASDPPAITPLLGVGSARSKPSLSSLPGDWMVS